MGKCVYNPDWGRKYSWVKAAKHNKHRAECSACGKEIDIGNMGESALKAHSKGERHIKLEKTISGSRLSFTCSSTVTKTNNVNEDSGQPSHVSVTTSEPNASCATVRPSLDTFFSGTQVLKSEIIWAMQTVTTHLSYKSNDNISPVFKELFPDSEIAKQFSCGEKKTAYLTVFGIAEHFKSKLVESVKGPYVLLFDESLNKKMQRKQLDLHIRFWSDNEGVATRYLGSEFIGHCKADDLLDHFKKVAFEEQPLDMLDLLQVSMDGPSVNWKFFEMLNSQIKTDYGHSLLNIGSCGLHVLHNAFKAGSEASEWEVTSFLSSLYYLFKDAPSRREDFVTVTNSIQMPLKFVKHRWLENVPVCRRALEIFDAVKQFVKAVEQKKCSTPTNNSFEVAKKCVKDPTFTAKMEFFCSIALILQPFLTNFQTDRPMTPFLVTELVLIIKTILRKFIKPELLDTAAENLLKIDIKEKKNHVTYNKVDVGIPAGEKLRQSKANDRSQMEFRLQAKAFMVALLEKLFNKCPVSYSLARHLSCFNPKEMVNDKEGCRSRFTKMLKHLLSAKRVQAEDCDLLKQEYDDFLDNIPVIGSEVFLEFNPYQDRVDDFLIKKMRGPNQTKLLQITQTVLLLSHGQASVERGFSVNKEIECENMKARTVTAQRIVCEEVMRAGGVLKINITQDLLKHASSARRRYSLYLDEQKNQNKKEIEERKRKSETAELEQLKTKCKQAKLDHTELLKSADDLCLKAEHLGKLEFLAKANALRQKAKEKEEMVQSLEEKIKSKEKQSV